jgi:uncharacterized membrane protein YphA (DoxX/SURF4 family)
MRGSDLAAVVARLILGVCFVYMGIAKALDPAGFLKQVHAYGVISSPFLLNSIAATLPWFEVWCGLLLVCGVAVRGASLLLLGMLVPFTALVTRRALEIASAKQLAFCAVKFDCGCGNGEVLICHKLLENSALILLALWLTARASGKLCARFRLFRPREDAPSSGAAT